LLAATPLWKNKARLLLVNGCITLKSYVNVYLGEELASYNFGQSHPFGPARHDAFKDEFYSRGLDTQVELRSPVLGNDDQILLFHSKSYLDRVKSQSVLGQGYLDHGDTPAFKGVYEAASWVVGTVIDAVDRIMNNETRFAFVPIAGLHHARRDSASGFCVFNDCGIAIEYLRQQYKLSKIAYVDIDAHHGDGVYYSFDKDADVIFADIHEDGKYLYPGTGSATELGVEEGKGKKLNIPMPPQADDEMMFIQWQKVEDFLNQFEPEFVILQAGADSIKNDPITHMEYSAKAHAHATKRLCELSKQWGHQRLLVQGGGGYNLENIAQAWTGVVEQLIAAN